MTLTSITFEELGPRFPSDYEHVSGAVQEALESKMAEFEFLSCSYRDLGTRDFSSLWGAYVTAVVDIQRHLCRTNINTLEMHLCCDHIATVQSNK